MPEIRPPVDLETVLVGELEADAELGPLTGGPGNSARISTRLPRDFDREAAVRLERVGGGPIGWPDHVDRALVNFHAYGPGDAEAFEVAGRLMVALARIEGRVVAGGVVTAVDRILGPTWTPDPDADNAPRYVLQVAVTAHPTPWDTG